MKRTKKLTIIILTMCIVFCQIVIATEDKMVDKTNAFLPFSEHSYVRYCNTVAELLIELEKDEGGEIEFVGDGPFRLEGTENNFIYEDIRVTQPVIVRMPPSGIVLGDDVLISLRGPITFTGTQGFVLDASAELFLFNGVTIDINQKDTMVSPSALNMQPKDTFTTPIAINISSEGRFYATSNVTVRAQGENAIALFTNNRRSMDLQHANIIAVGDNSTAVASTTDLMLLHGFLHTEGEGSHAIRSTGLVELVQISANGHVEGYPVYSALSTFSNPPENLIELEVTLEPNIRLRQTTLYPDSDIEYESIDFRTIGGPEYTYHSVFDDSPDYGFAVYCNIEWDLHDLNYPTPGIYTATAEMHPFVSIPGFTVDPLTHVVTVQPFNKAAINAQRSYEDYVEVELIKPIVGAEKILFWVYEEETGWRELTATENAIYTVEKPFVWYSFFEPEETAFFVVTGLKTYSNFWVTAQVIGGSMDGFSNIWNISTVPFNGGDRTGTDRVGVKPSTLPHIKDNDKDINKDNESPRNETNITEDEYQQDIENPLFNKIVSTFSNDKTSETTKETTKSVHSENNINNAKIPFDDKVTNQDLSSSQESLDNDNTNDQETNLVTVLVEKPTVNNEYSASEKSTPNQNNVNSKIGNSHTAQQTKEILQPITTQKEPEETQSPVEQAQVPLTQSSNSEQSAPKPAFSVNTLTIIFLGIAVLGSVSLLLLYLYKCGILRRLRR